MQGISADWSVIWDMQDSVGLCDETAESIVAIPVTPVQTNVTATVSPVAFNETKLNFDEVHLAPVKQSICISTGVKETAQGENGFQVYPNPFTSEFVLESSEVLQNAELKIFDLTGKLLYNRELEGNKFTIRLSLPPSVYLARIKDSRGTLHTIKLVSAD